MKTLRLTTEDRPVSVLALGAHCDDIEIGCGGLLLQWVAQQPMHVEWIVFSSNPVREQETRTSASLFLANANSRSVSIERFRNGHFPSALAEVKDYFEGLKQRSSPDVVLTHYRHDRHQDHRTISDLTWNTFRSHLILEYEIFKYDGDLGQPNFFVPIDEATKDRKIEYLMSAYQSQSGKQWFDRDTFNALMRLRGGEIDSPSRFAEAFYCRKLCFNALK